MAESGLLARCVDEGTEAMHFAVHFDLRAALQPIFRRADLVILAEFQDRELTGPGQCEQPADRHQRHCCIVVDDEMNALKCR